MFWPKVAKIRILQKSPQTHLNSTLKFETALEHPVRNPTERRHQVFDHVDDRVLLAAAQPAHPHAVHPPLGALQPHARLPHLSAVSRIPPHHSPGRLRYTTFCYKQLFNSNFNLILIFKLKSLKRT